MSDAGYATSNLILQSKGICARYVDDQTPTNVYLNQNSLEEIEEGGLATRLGTLILSQSGNVAYPLGGSAGIVHSLAKLAGLGGAAWRYGGKGAGLYRLSGLFPGQYTQISNSLSGQPWSAVAFQPVVSSAPILFIADANGMLKDNGTQAAPSQMGIFQPQYPVSAQAQAPDQIILDDYTGALSYNYPSGGSGTLVPGGLVSTTTTSAVTATGIQTVNVLAGAAGIQQISLFQLLTIDSGANQETVLAIFVTETGFSANFTKTHASGVAVTAASLSMTVAASSTQSVNASFAGTPIANWPTTLDQEDYIGLNIFVEDPTQVQSIQLSFDCGDGTFESDYFYKVIAQGPLQALLSTAASNSTAATTAATDALLDQTLGLYGNSEGSIAQLNTGLNNWTPLLIQLSDFAGAGRANFDDPVFNWSAVNGYQITVVMNDQTSTTIQLGSLVLFGGAGPDSFAGVSYDYLVTFFNIVDFSESNPTMVMSNVNPPSLTSFVVPRRQPVLLNITHPTLDPQTTHLRVYRRGGTLGDNYRRIDQVPCSGTTTKYLDIFSDLEIQGADTVSFTNDVPVTSSLPVPVNTTLTAAIGTVGQAVNAVVTITPASMQSISVRQQVNLGNVLNPNYETVIVLTVETNSFTAFVQNAHLEGETVAATASYGQPVDIIQVAYNMGWFAGDPQNPSYLYNSAAANIQAVSSAAYTPVSAPSDPITAIVNSRGNLFVSTLLRWWSVAPGSNATSQPTVYPTAADHGTVGKNAWTLKDGIIYYWAVDGPRICTGGSGQLISEIIQFIIQGVGPTPIVQADPTQFANIRASYWNQFVQFAYAGIDGKQHRLVLDVEQKRWRNDDVDAQSMLIEEDTNTLVFGDSVGLVHLDRQNVAYDQTNVGGVVTNSPVAITLQTPFSDQGQPQIQKNYNEFTGDFNTNGNPVTVQLAFNDGEIVETIGTITTTERQRVNLNLNGGEGFQAYKVSLILTGSGTKRISLYQAALRSLKLGETRQSYDSYWLRMGIDESKILKQLYAEVTASQAITCSVYYDGSSVAGYTFTIPYFGGVRNAFRFRLPAVKFRTVRFVFTSTGDFILWETSKYEWKPLCQGKGYSTALLMT